MCGQKRKRNMEESKRKSNHLYSWRSRGTRHRRRVLSGFIREQSLKDVPDGIQEMILRYVYSEPHWKLNNIYTPPGSDSDSDDSNACENATFPAWHRHFPDGVDDLQGRYEPVREIGRGSYSVMYEGKSLKKWGRLEANTTVTIKMVRRVFHTEEDATRLLRELRILRILRRHDSIISMYDIIPPKEPQRFATLTIVFEFGDADLHKVFRTNQFFTTLQVQFMLFQILLGTKYMHSAKIVHRDLKPASILINEDCSIKICDFGLARSFSEDDEQRRKL